MRRQLQRHFILVAAVALQACTATGTPAAAPQPWTEAWYAAVESRVGTGDGQGHGPDPGSGEWRSVVEFRLGIRGDPSVPARDGSTWCDYIDDIVFQSAGRQG